MQDTSIQEMFSWMCKSADNFHQNHIVMLLMRPLHKHKDMACCKTYQVLSDRHFNNNITAWLTLSVLCLHESDQTQPKHLCTWARHSRGGAEDVFWMAVISIPLDPLWDIPCWFCTVFRFFLFASWSKAKAFDQDFQRIPLVLLASTLTGQWWSNDNYSSHLVSLELAPTASRTLRPRRKERFLDG